MENDRKTYIGGSDIPQILGLSPWGGPVDCWLDKVGKPIEADDEKPVLKRGKRLERYIRDLIEEEFNITPRMPNLRHADPVVSYFSAEIDFEYWDVETGAIENGEIKTVHPFKSREWGAADSDDLPLFYIAQNLWSLGVTKRRRCRTFALIGDDLKPYVVNRDEITIEAMREQAAKFWVDYVVTRRRPPMAFEDEHSLEIVRRMYPGTNGKEIRATAAEESWRSVMQDAQSKADKYLNVVHGAKAHLLDVMGENALLRFDDGSALRRKLIEVSGYVVEPRKQIDSRFVKGKG